MRGEVTWRYENQSMIDYTKLTDQYNLKVNGTGTLWLKLGSYIRWRHKGTGLVQNLIPAKAWSTLIFPSFSTPHKYNISIISLQWSCEIEQKIAGRGDIMKINQWLRVIMAIVLVVSVQGCDYPTTAISDFVSSLLAEDSSLDDATASDDSSSTDSSSDDATASDDSSSTDS
jgi:hypothetical protein